MFALFLERNVLAIVCRLRLVLQSIFLLNLPLLLAKLGLFEGTLLRQHLHLLLGVLVVKVFVEASDAGT